MKAIFALLLAGILCSCQAPHTHEATLEDTQKIGSEEIARLPRKLKYSELAGLWGPAVTADPFFIYRSKIDGLVLGIFVDYPASDPFFDKPPDPEIIGMYFMDMKSFNLHAWGRDVIQEYSNRKE